MDIYVVWKEPHDGNKDYIMGNDNIEGVYINELLAYKTGCIKQVYDYLDMVGDNVQDNMKEWMQNNPLPDVEETDVEVWKKYFNIVADNYFIFNLYKDDDDRYGDNIPFYNKYHITKKVIKNEY